MNILKVFNVFLVPALCLVFFRLDEEVNVVHLELTKGIGLNSNFVQSF